MPASGGREVGDEELVTRRLYGCAGGRGNGANAASSWQKASLSSSLEKISFAQVPVACRESDLHRPKKALTGITSPMKRPELGNDELGSDPAAGTAQHCRRYTFMDNSHQSQSLAVEYETALFEEQLLWKQLDDPQLDVSERVKAAARWSAAAERARALSLRVQESLAQTQ
jgi:hypothetical protein